MNNSIIIKNSGVIVVILALFLLGSCKKSETYDFLGDNTTRVFLNVENYNVNSYNGYLFSIKHTPIGSIGSVSASFPVRSTEQVIEDTNVNFQVDNSLVVAYNARNNTKYSIIPAGTLDMAVAQLTIPKGASISSAMLNLSIPAGKLSQLTDTGYLVPVKISAVTGSAIISSNLDIVYLKVSTRVSNVYDSPIITDMTGTLIANRTSWTATLDVTPTSGTLSTMFDARTNTSWYLTPAKISNMVVDMATPYAGISGVRIHTSTTTYYLTSANIYTSLDGVTWTLQGAAKFSIINAYQYVKFYAAVPARYIKMEITGWRATSATTRIMFTEFDVYNAN